MPGAKWLIKMNKCLNKRWKSARMDKVLAKTIKKLKSTHILKFFFQSLYEIHISTLPP